MAPYHQNRIFASNDRRVGRRATCGLEVKFSKNGRWARGLMVDVSLEGARVLTGQPVEKGECVTLAFEDFSPFGSSLLQGEVAWHQSKSEDQLPGMGIRLRRHFNTQN